MDYNNLTTEERLKLYDGIRYWCYNFPNQFLWLVFAFFASFIANGGIIIRVGIVIYFIIGVCQYCHYKEVDKFLYENNPYRKK